jgi:predicted nucleic acid-binding protein
LSQIVLDSSLALAWYLEDEQNDYADGVLAALDGDEGVVPPLWPYEVANALWMAERRGRTTAAHIQRVLALLQALPIRVDTRGYERAQREVLGLARREGLTVYDAAYLELAIREGLPLATLDTQLRAAAVRVSVPAFDSA